MISGLHRCASRVFRREPGIGMRSVIPWWSNDEALLGTMKRLHPAVQSEDANPPAGSGHVFF